MVDKKKIRSLKPKIFSYACSFFSQRPDSNAPSFCVFSASVGDIRKWADIERLSPGVPGIQRRQNFTKCRQITKFFEISSINTIPTALIIAFDADLVSEYKKKGKLQISRTPDGGPKAGLVIDGQHRLLGISDFDKTVKVAVVGILNCDDIEKAFQFLVINNKGSKVSPNHIKALALTYKEKDLAERLKLARIVVDQDRLIHVGILNSSKDSPFFNRVDFPNTKGSLKKIVPEAFEKALQYIESLNLPKLDDADVQRDFFTAIWSEIKKTWGDEIFAKGNKLTEKVGIICMTRFMVDRLASMADLEDIDLDLSDLEEVKRKVINNLNRQTIEFWNAKWKGSGYDTAIGHATVMEALTKISRNIKGDKEWMSSIDML